MANQDRERHETRGMFGYEGEGFMRNEDDYDDFARNGYGRSEGDDYSIGFSGGYGTQPRHMGSDLGSDRGWNIGRDSDLAQPRRSYRGLGPKNYRRSDERIREDVCERLALDHDLDASDIEVTVADGVVTLEGTVDDRRAKRLAEDVSDLVRGVRDVENNIRVKRVE